MFSSFSPTDVLATRLSEALLRSKGLGLFLSWSCHLNLLHHVLVPLDWETACLSKPAFNVFVSLQ